MFQFIAHLGRQLEIFRLDGLGQFLLQRLEPFRRVARLAERFRRLANVPRALVHRLEQAFQPFGENLVTFRAAEPAGLLEIRLRKAAARAFQIHAAGGLRDLLRRAEAEQQVRVRERERRRIVHALGLGAILAQVHFVHLVILNVGEKNGRRFFFADGTLHKLLNPKRNYFFLRGGNSRMNAHETSAVWPLL